MTPDEFRAELERQATELRAVNDRLDRMNRVGDAPTAAALAASMPSVPAPPPPPAPGGTTPGLPTFGPRPTPAPGLGNGPPLSRDRLMELALRHKAQEAERRAYFAREQAAVIAHMGRIPVGPPQPRRSRVG